MQAAAPTISYEIQSRYIPRRTRIWEIDFIRGICVLLMILDHLATLLGDYFAVSWYGSGYYLAGLGDAFSRFCYFWLHGCGARDVIHQIVLFFFIGICGVSCTLSRSNLKRGAGLGVIAILYSFCSLFADKVMGISDVTTTFGVLDFLAVCILLYELISWACKRDPYRTSIVSAGIMGIALILYFCFTPPESTPLFFGIIFPDEDFYGTASLFYKQSDISPGDLFPMIPYCVYFFCGVLLAPIFYGNRKSLLPKLDGKWNKPVCFVGRHALIIYLAHLVLLALILAAISFLFITPGDFGI